MENMAVGQHVHHTGESVEYGFFKKATMVQLKLHSYLYVWDT